MFCTLPASRVSYDTNDLLVWLLALGRERALRERLLLRRPAAFVVIIDMLVAIARTKVPILLDRGSRAMAHESRTDWVDAPRLPLPRRCWRRWKASISKLQIVRPTSDPQSDLAAVASATLRPVRPLESGVPHSITVALYPSVLIAAIICSTVTFAGS